MDFLKGLTAGFTSPKVLDIATGTGQMIEFFAELLPEDARFTGVDTDERLFEIAKRRMTGIDLEFKVGDAQKLPFADGIFDIAIMGNSLHHLSEPERAMAEMWRVTSPGGLCLVMEMTSDGQGKPEMSHLFFHHFTGEIDRHFGRYHRNTYTRDELLDIFHKGTGTRPASHFEVWDEPPESMAEGKINVLKNRYEPVFAKLGEKEGYFKKQRDELIEYIEKNGYKPCSSLFMWAVKDR